MEHDQGSAPGTGSVPAPDAVPVHLHGTRNPIMVGTRDVPPPAPPAAPVPTGTRNLVPDGKISCTGDAVREWVRTALALAGTGERYHYDVSLVMVPGPAAVMSAYAIVIYVPSPVLNQSAIGTVKLVDDFPTEIAITNAVRPAVAELRDKQSATIQIPSGTKLRPI